MGALTSRVFAKANEDADDLIKKVLEVVQVQLPNECHIEHILSQLADYATIAKRSKEMEEMTEVERLRAENKMLKAENKQKEMEIAVLKKVREIERRRG